MFQPSRVLAGLHHRYIRFKTLPDLETHLTWWPVNFEGSNRDDHLLLLLTRLPELTLPSLFLRSLDIIYCQKVAMSPFFVDSESNWSPASLHTLRKLAVQDSLHPEITSFYGGRPSYLPPESARNLEQFMASLLHCTSLATLQVCYTPLAAASLHVWTSLQSLQSLSLFDVSFADSRAITSELQFISQLIHLTRLELINSNEQLMGEVFPTLCRLSHLHEAAVSCFNPEQFKAVASLTFLRTLALEYCPDQYGPEVLDFLSTKVQVRFLITHPLIGDRWRSFGQRLHFQGPDKDGLSLCLLLKNETQEEAAFKTVRRMRSLNRTFVGGVIRQGSLRCLDGIQCCLDMHRPIGDPVVQKIAWINSLKHVCIREYIGTAAGLSCLRLMPNLERVELLHVKDERVRSVLPRELLEGQSLACDED